MSETKVDGGQAYPSKVRAGAVGSGLMEVEEGMTMQQFYQGHALGGLLAADPEGNLTYAEAARQAREHALAQVALDAEMSS